MSERDALGALARILRKAPERGVSVEHDRAEEDRFVEALARRGRTRRRSRVLLLVAATLAALAIVVVAIRPPLGRPLAYSVSGARAAENGYVTAADGPASIRFDDGSVAELEPATSMRVAATSQGGARLVLEEGQSRINVVGRTRTDWVVEAGPFVIAVTGTRFVARWARASEELVLRMEEGTVRVTGPLLAPGVDVASGQTLVASTKRGRIEIAESAASARVAPATSVAPPASGSAGPGASAAKRAATWSERVARGEYQSVLEEADRMGIESALSRSSADDLVALADAARYARRADLAGRALRSIRTRFPGSAAAKSAAFMLGRMVDGGGSSASIEWYDTYLREAPNGTFALEAEGRRLAAVYRAHGRAAAKPLAESYLRSHANGPHASLAREITKSP